MKHIYMPIQVLRLCLMLSLLSSIVKAQDYLPDSLQQIQVKQESYQLQTYTDKLFEEVYTPNLNETQMKYLGALNGFQKSKSQSGFLRVNTNLLKQEDVITINYPAIGNQDIISYEIEEKEGGRLFWKGKSSNGEITAKFIVNGEMVTGQIQTMDAIYQLRPLSGNLHAIMPTPTEEEHNCGYHGQLPTKTGKKENPFKDVHIPDDITQSRKSSSPECDVRLMVVYTNSVDNLSPNIADLIELEIDNFNDINNNSDVNFNVKLARSLEVNYTETNQELTHPQVPSWDVSRDLYRLWHPNDGWMDNVHTERNLYDADMVLFMVDRLPGYGGLAFNVGVNAADAFCIMRWNNGNHTFTHEFGHLIGMWHNTENSPGPGASTVPFSYGYAHYWTGAGPNFRTVMSYSNPCGASGCPRIPYWSNPNLDYGPNSVSLGAANKNNARVANEQEATISNFQNTVANKKVFANTSVFNRQSGNLIATQTIDTDNKTVRYFNGSSGEYRAPNSITFKPGFQAYSGSNFRGRIAGCFNFVITGTTVITTTLGDEEAGNKTAANPSDTEENKSITDFNTLDLTIYPNPVNHQGTIEVTLPVATSVKIDLYDTHNRLVKPLVLQNQFSEGFHRLTFTVGELPTGVYTARLLAGKQVLSKRIVISQ